MRISITKELNSALLAQLENNERITEYVIDLDLLKNHVDKDFLKNVIQQISKQNPSLGFMINQLLLII